LKVGDKIKIGKADPFVEQVVKSMQVEHDKIDKAKKGQEIGLKVKGNPEKGPKMSRMPDKIVLDAIKGMLPIKKSRGKKALKNVKVFIGTPIDVNPLPSSLTGFNAPADGDHAFSRAASYAAI